MKGKRNKGREEKNGKKGEKRYKFNKGRNYDTIFYLKRKKDIF